MKYTAVVEPVWSSKELEIIYIVYGDILYREEKWLQIYQKEKPV